MGMRDIRGSIEFIDIDAGCVAVRKQVNGRSVFVGVIRLETEGWRYWPHKAPPTLATFKKLEVCKDAVAGVE